jgi:hypothetical protein
MTVQKKKSWKCIGCGFKIKEIKFKDVKEMFEHILSHQPEAHYMDIRTWKFYTEDLEKCWIKNYDGYEGRAMNLL